MKSINTCISLLLTLAITSSISVAPADAKKEFSKSDGTATSALGENTVTMPSGVKYKDIKLGTGQGFKYGNVVWVDYIGWIMPDLKEYDNSLKRGRPFVFTWGSAQICKGFDEGMTGMKVGGKRLLLVPPELAFPKGNSAVPAGSAIKYEVTLLSVGSAPVVTPVKGAANTGKTPNTPPKKTAPKSK